MKFKNRMIVGAVAVVAFVLYLVTMAGFAYPGESAKLIALWRGLDVAAVEPYPLMSVFAKLFGGGNLLAPICGAASVALVYLLTSQFIRNRISGEKTSDFRSVASRIAGLVAATIYALTPAVWSAATHLEPRMFTFTWALAAIALFIPWSRCGYVMSFVYPVLMALMFGLGLTDSPIFLALLPLVLFAVWKISGGRGFRPWVSLTILIFVFIVVYAIAAAAWSGDLVECTRTMWSRMRSYYTVPGWLFVFFFSTIPFVTAIFSSDKAFDDDNGIVNWTFHLAMSFFSILAIATTLSPTSQMEPFGILPVATSAFAAITAGYLAAYWWIQSKSEARAGRIIGMASCGLLGVVYVFAIFLGIISFDSSRGAFADEVARKIIADLGDRPWFVTDGSLDNHLRLAAAKDGRNLELICLSRDLDQDYLDRLSKTVAEKKLGGEKCSDLALSLSLGVLPFVQDWFTVDPEAAKETAIFGASDLWYSSGLKSVPEFFFFGADPERKVDVAAAWEKFGKVLEVDKEWQTSGSYKIRRIKNPIDRMQYELRRHIGLVMNNRGVYLQDQKLDDEAFALYELVLNEIDPGNICALFNLFEMARAGHPKAVQKKFDYEKRIKRIVDDADRRYRLWSLSNYYGYIRSPDIFLRLGFTWARSGRPGDALSQIKRAIDFIPTDRRNSILNMMAALYASEDNQVKSRAIYEKVLEKKADDHDALVGMMRLALQEGDSAKALEYLEKAVKSGGDDPRVRVELAMMLLMKGELPKAREVLTKITDSDANDLRAWSLLAAVVMQQCDSAKDAAEKKAFAKELEDVILPTMEKQARSPYDYYVQTTRAFILLRQGEAKRKAARDAFVTAAKARPDIAATQDLVLGLDISLNDVEGASQHAREVLRRNRKAPLANYVMGSLALQKNDYLSAEQYLKRAADAKKPVALALNDLAEVYRRTERFQEAEKYARLAVREAPKLYVAWETLGAVLMDRKGNLDEAERCVEKACEMSKDAKGKEADIRMLISLARIQSLKGDRQRCNMTLRKVQPRIAELSEFEQREYSELVKKNAK